MRGLNSWAVAIVGLGFVCASSCLTSQDNPGGGGVEDPPVNSRGGSGGSVSTGGDAGEATGGRPSRGGSGGTSGTGNGEGGADGCSADDDCASRVDDRARCSVPTGDCVECLTVADCEANEECANNDCRPITTCMTTDDCPHDTVCNPATQVCVECVGAAGCAAGDVCVANTCRKPCTTDSQCILFGLRCDRGDGFCASCISNGDCPDDQNCQNGSCVRDICIEGSGSCNGNVLTTCTAGGSQMGYPMACLTRQTCTEDSAGARCEDWVCEPGQMGCSLTSETVVSCSDDGLTETLEEDCEAAGLLCVGTIGGACVDVVCEPNARSCMGNTVMICDTAGTMLSPLQTCTTGQFCNPALMPPGCAPQLCTPNQPACDGNVFTTCNALGSGYTGTRTDCAMTMEFCGLTGCTTSAVDTIPAMPTLYGSALSAYVMVNIYSVTSARNLALIEQYMSPTVSMTINWHVYESLTQSGTYNSIFTTTTMSTTGAGYQSSGALSVPLVAGRFYAIGFSWTTPALNFGYQTAAAAQPTSFGSLLGAYFTTTAPTMTLVPSLTTSAYLPQRLTTVP